MGRWQREKMLRWLDRDLISCRHPGLKIPEMGTARRKLEF